MLPKEENNGFIVFACKDNFTSNSMRIVYAITGRTMALPISVKSERDVESVIKEIKANNITEYQVFTKGQEVQVTSYVETLISNQVGLENRVVVKVEFIKLNKS